MPENIPQENTYEDFDFLSYLCIYLSNFPREGACVGFAHMGKQAILSKQMNHFDNRIEILRKFPASQLHEKITQARKIHQQIDNQVKHNLNKDFFLSIEQKNTLLETHRKLKHIIKEIYDRTDLDLLEKTRRENSIFMNAYIQNEIRKNYTDEKLSLILEIPAFFEGLIQYQITYKFRHLYPKENLPCKQDAEKATQLALCEVLEELGIFKFEERISGTYTLKDLEYFFYQFKSKAEFYKISENIALVLNSGNHTITVGYNRLENEWIFIDGGLSTLETIYFDANTLDIAKEVMSALTENDYAIFSTEIWMLKSEKNVVLKLISTWRSEKYWQEMHLITSEKANHKDSYNSTWLYVACANEDLQRVQTLLTQSTTHINLGNLNGQTPLHFASACGHSEIVKELLNKNANPNVLLDSGATPLYLAAQYGHKDVIALLLANKAHPNLTCVKGQSPLYIAVQNNHIETVKMLLEHNADPNLCWDGDISPLFIAAEDGHLDIVKLLLSQDNIDINIPCNYVLEESTSETSFTAKEIARHMGHDDIVKYLEEFEQTKSIDNKNFGFFQKNKKRSANDPDIEAEAIKKFKAQNI